MPELQFKGKEFVYNHHLSVPFRPLVPDAAKSVGKPSLNGNLIIHGDNLHALKALLPMYAGKVDCIFIDPPYNTGNEGWSYNDNVNSPMMKEWLSSNPINGEDMLRHDKWCAMMWPRLTLLRELLSPTGSFWMTIDDNEVHHARGYWMKCLVKVASSHRSYGRRGPLQSLASGLELRTITFSFTGMEAQTRAYGNFH